MDLARLCEDIKREEGAVKLHGRHVVYDDATGKPAKGTGKLTIGYGRNLEERGISDREAEAMLRADVEHAAHYAQQLVSVGAWAAMGEIRREVLTQMVFQLGFHGTRKFGRMLAAIERGDYAAAAREMIDSNWYRQTTARAMTLAERMRTGRA